MAKLCLDSRTSQGLIFFVAGIVLLLLAYFRNFSSLIFIVGALAALAYGAVVLGIPQRVMGFFHKK